MKLIDKSKEEVIDIMENCYLKKTDKMISSILLRIFLFFRKGLHRA